MGVPGGPSPQCRTGLVCGVLLGRSLGPGNVYHFEECSQYHLGAGLTPGSTSVIYRKYEIEVQQR